MREKEENICDVCDQEWQNSLSVLSGISGDAHLDIF